MKKAVVLTANKFEDMEVFFPVFRLMEEGWQVDIAAPEKEEISGENGYSLMPDKTIDQINADDYDFWLVRIFCRLSAGRFPPKYYVYGNPWRELTQKV